MIHTYIHVTIVRDMHSDGRQGFPEEMAMGKATVYYFIFFDTDTQELVRPRRPGTLEAIRSTGIESAQPLMSTALEVEESALDEHGFYPGRYQRMQGV